MAVRFNLVITNRNDSSRVTVARRYAAWLPLLAGLWGCGDAQGALPAEVEATPWTRGAEDAAQVGRPMDTILGKGAEGTAAASGFLPDDALSFGQTGEPITPALSRDDAARAWRASPDEASAVAMAAAYFPELAVADDLAASEDELKNDGARLWVKPPALEGEPMQIETRGYVFTVEETLEEREPPAAGRARSLKSALFHSPNRFLMPIGGRNEAGRWATHRVEGYAIAEGGDTDHIERLQVTVPEGITSVRDADTYLEMMNREDTPVLRLHYIVARDSEGLSRQGEVRLHGVTKAAPAPGDTRPLYALSARTLSIEMSVDLSDMVGPVVIDPGFSSTGAMAQPRVLHTTTLLPTGKVLAAGGYGGGNDAPSYASAELYDPATGAWSSTSSMIQPRRLHTATVLPSGKVLLASGTISFGVAAGSEIYDPATGTFSQTGAMGTPRFRHTSTLLPSGKVLVVAGYPASGQALSSAELYDPATGTWSGTGSMVVGVTGHTATLLPSTGKVLVTGGYGAGARSQAALYDPATGMFSATGNMSVGRYFHTATLMPSGDVIVTGGSSSLTSAEQYNPATGTFSGVAPMATGRQWHSAALLPSGKLLVLGGQSGLGAVTASTELYDPATNTWAPAIAMGSPRYWPNTVILPSGKLLVAGGCPSASNGSAAVASSELYTPNSGSFVGTGSMALARRWASAALLPSGKVLIAGGNATYNGSVEATAEVYDPVAGTWSSAASMATARRDHVAATLPSGEVLIVGASSLNPERFNETTGTWASAGIMNMNHSGHTVTVLSTGKALVVGALFNVKAELFDPATAAWTFTAGAMWSAHTDHTATLLPSGKVLVAGGSNGSGTVTMSEIYDPSSGTWSRTEDATDAFTTLSTPRQQHSATLLPSGKVLVAGGRSTGPSGAAHSSAELFDPAAGTWTPLASQLSAPRYDHAAVLLPSGRVLLVGGLTTGGSALATAELFDPVTLAWSSVPMTTARTDLALVRLANNKVLVAGGGQGITSLKTAELYDDTGYTGVNEAWRPVVNSPDVVTRGVSFTASGLRLRGISEADSGTASLTSMASFPFVTLTPLQGGSPIALPGSSMSSTSVQLTAPASAAPGRYLLQVTANGIAGGRLVQVN